MVPHHRPAEPGVPTPAGDTRFDAIYEEHFTYGWNCLVRLGVPERDVEDLLHDLFTIVYKNLDRYDTARPIHPWLFGIAFRVASRYRRSGRVRREVLGQSSELGEDLALPADERVLQDERARLLLRALDDLDLDRRAVFVLHEIDLRPMPEIARTLGIPLNTAYSRLRLARADVTVAVARFGANKR